MNDADRSQHPIPQMDPKAGLEAHLAEVNDAIRRVLESGCYILGNEVEQFEREFAAYLGTHHAVGVASGTDALHLALRVGGVVAGDRVITVSHTAVATVAAIELAGAVPVFADVDETTMNMDPGSLEEVLERLDRPPRALVAVHLYGSPADMPAILNIARNHNLFVIEDCAQSHGAMIDGRKTGTWGDVAAFSFYPTKNLGALGDGGALATSSAEFAARARDQRQYGWRERSVSRTPGMNTRLDEIQAAILRVKLRHLDVDNRRRRQIARDYDRNFEEMPLVLPSTRERHHSVYHQYAVRTPHRNDLMGFLEEQGIRTAIHYPYPVHLQPAYHGRLPEVVPLPNSESAAQTVLSLPMYPGLREEDARRIWTAVKGWDPSKQSSRPATREPSRDHGDR